ncbi:unnamed protein product, partial [Ectocarpus fasciculatus]
QHVSSGRHNDRMLAPADTTRTRCYFVHWAAAAIRVVHVQQVHIYMVTPPASAGQYDSRANVRGGCRKPELAGSEVCPTGGGVVGSGTAIQGVKTGVVATSTSRWSGYSPCVKTPLARVQESTPRIPWRVSLLARSTINRDGNISNSSPPQRAAEEDYPSFCSVFPSPHDQSSTSGLLAGVPSTALSSTDEVSPSVSSRMKRSTTTTTTPSTSLAILVHGVVEDSSSCDSATAARTRTEVVESALREREALVRHPGPPEVHHQIKPGMVQTAEGDTPRNTRGWCPAQKTTRIIRGMSLPVREGASRSRGRLREAARTQATAMSPSEANQELVDVRAASWVPKEPPRQLHRPRPIWAVLRNRTLKVAQQDPCIFRGTNKNELEGGADGVSRTRQMPPWQILNRRIFGFREV